MSDIIYAHTYFCGCGSRIRLKTSKICAICTSLLSVWQTVPDEDICCPIHLKEQEEGVGKEKKRRKKMQQAGTLKMSYYVWSLNPLSPANTFLWLVSKSDKACVCSQLIDRTVLIKQYPSLGKESPQSHFTFSSLYCTKVFFLDEFIFLKLKFEFSESAALISLLNNYLLTG